MVVTVLGGSSVASPLLLEALGALRLQGELPPLTVRLWGRAQDRLEGIVAHARWRLDGRGVTGLAIQSPPLLAEALTGATLVICQVRPGGFSGRMRLEQISLGAGLPGDEGLGPGGLASFLWGRDEMDALRRALRTLAPQAVLLQMTSPLGVMVARDRAFGLQSWGLCELPVTTARKVCDALLSRFGPLTTLHAGLNHQAWLHVFRDEGGRDRTKEVVEAIDDPDLVRVDPAFIQHDGAVPLPYLRLFHHRDREVALQRARPSRAATLLRWSASLHDAYVSSPDHPQIDALLRQRHVDWYREAVAPAVAAFLSPEPRVLPLTGPLANALPGVPTDAIVELPCQVSLDGVTPVQVPPLPPRPQALVRALLTWEAAVLGMADEFRVPDVAAVLSLHPWITSTDQAQQVARAILQR